MDKIHQILQDEIASKVFYESRSCEEALTNGLAKAEIRLRAENKRLREALENLLVGHYNLYKKVWGEQSDPEVDIVRKIAKQALKEG